MPAETRTPTNALRAKLAELRAKMAEMPPLPWVASDMGPISGQHYWMEFGSVKPDIPVGEIEREQWDTGRNMVDVLNRYPVIIDLLEALLDERELREPIDVEPGTELAAAVERVEAAVGMLLDAK